MLELQQFQNLQDQWDTIVYSRFTILSIFNWDSNVSIIFRIQSRTSKIFWKTKVSLFVLSTTRGDSGITCSASAHHGKVMGSAVVILVPDARPCTSMLGFGLDGLMLDPKRGISKYDKRCTYCYYVRCVTLIVRVGGNAFAPNRRNSLPCTVQIHNM